MYFLEELVFFSLLCGRGTMSILLISPVADISDLVSPLKDAEMQIYNSFSGAGMKVYNSFSGAGIMVLSMCGWDIHSSALGLQTQQLYYSQTEKKILVFLRE
jgi:hypothetical protein